jgi:hypothetical protein
MHINQMLVFGEHYGSLIASSGALVDLENELQSA